MGRASYDPYHIYYDNGNGASNDLPNTNDPRGNYTQWDDPDESPEYVYVKVVNDTTPPPPTGGDRL
jgi:hypothetical protein